MNLPRNGQALVDLRMRRMVPDLPVLISLVGPLEFNNVTLLSDAGVGYDWRAISALEIEVFTNVSIPFAKVLRTLADLAAAVPDRMVLTFVDGPRIDCGELRRVTDFALFDWFPMAVGPKFYLEGTKVARRLWSELGRSLPIPYDEALNLVLQIATEQQQCA